MDAYGMLAGIASEARLGPYLGACGGDRRAAVRLYTWNIRVSSAFQAPLGCLEVAAGTPCTNASRTCSGGTTGGFGFWVSLLGSGTDYETRLWRPALCSAFPGYRGRRSPLHQELDEGRKLRNRIAHHEPLHRRDLAADHARTMRLLAYIAPGYAAWVQEHDRVPEVLAARGDVCDGLLSATF